MGAAWAGTGGVGGVRRPPVVPDPRSLRHGHWPATITDNPVSAPTSTAWNPPPPNRAIGQVPRTAGPQEPAVWLSGRPEPRLEHLYESDAAAYTRRPVAARSKDPLAPFGPAVRAWFEATFEAPTPAQAQGWAAISAGPQHPDPCAHRQRQDPGRVPVVPRPAGPTSPAGTHARGPGERPRPVHQPAQGPRLRRGAQPARPAGGHHAGRAAPRAGAAAHLDREPHRRHPGRRAPRPRPPPAGHPDHHAGEPLPAADQPGARGPAGRRAGHRGRGPRCRREQARRPPRAEPGAPRAPED